MSRMTTCRTCGAMIAENASSCRHCGDNRNQISRAAFALVAILVIAILFVLSRRFW
jgi:RNA polymerase subunit RPABC4/transcription elongation factor Spt4